MTGTLTARPSRRTPVIPALPRPARVVLGGDFISAVGRGLTLPCLRLPAQPADAPDPPQRPPASYRQVLRDRAFVRVWVLTALMVTVGFGQFQASFAGFATRPGGISPHGLGLAFAANTLTVMAVQLVVLRRLAGRQPHPGTARDQSGSDSGRLAVSVLEQIKTGCPNLFL